MGERATAATPQHEPAGSKRQSDDEVDDTDKVVDSASDPGAEVQSKTNRGSLLISSYKRCLLLPLFLVEW